MRKAAREQREAKSKRIELLILTLMGTLIFFSLFYTVPLRVYVPSFIEYTVYLCNSALQFFLLITLINSRDGSSEKLSRSKQRYAITGAGVGLLLFYIYFQLIG